MCKVGLSSRLGSPSPLRRLAAPTLSSNTPPLPPRRSAADAAFAVLTVAAVHVATANTRS